jgi:hypothetical protein
LILLLKIQMISHIKVNGDSTSSYGEDKRAMVFFYDVYGKPTASQTKIISTS